MLTIYSCIIDHHFEVPLDQYNEMTQVMIFLAVVCNVVMGVSRRASDFILNILIIIAQLVNQTLGYDLAINVPQDIRTAMLHFKLDGQTTVYAVFPGCHCTYEPKVDTVTGALQYPERCTNIPEPGSKQCGELLLTNNGKSNAPIKTFVYHHFHDYLAGLLARKDLEGMMDKACDDFLETRHIDTDYIDDVFGGQFLKTFKGPDHKHLFLDRKKEGRYVFSLNVDFFNVQQNRLSGAHTSHGIISMSCLNLPHHLRFKPENMHIVGIVPGPKEPKLTKINHYLKPLVDDMAESWHRGVQYTSTALYPEGRLTKSAIILNVMDLLGARKAAGMAGPTSHHFCTVCTLHGVENLGKTDWENWTHKFG